MSISRTRLAAVAFVVISAGLLSACNPTLRSHGFRYTDGEVPEILVGQARGSQGRSRLPPSYRMRVATTSSRVTHR